MRRLVSVTCSDLALSCCIRADYRQRVSTQRLMSMSADEAMNSIRVDELRGGHGGGRLSEPGSVRQDLTKRLNEQREYTVKASSSPLKNPDFKCTLVCYCCSYLLINALISHNYPSCKNLKEVERFTSLQLEQGTCSVLLSVNEF